MATLGWENGRLVPVSVDDSDYDGIRAAGVDGTHAIWDALDTYIRICESITAERGLALPPEFGRVDLVSPWLPRVVATSATWKRCQEDTRRLGTIHFGMLTVEHFRPSSAHYQHAITPLSVTYDLGCSLPGFPFSLRGQRFWLDVLHVHEAFVRDDRMGRAEQVALALGHAWAVMAERIQLAAPIMLARCVRKGGVAK